MGDSEVSPAPKKAKTGEIKNGAECVGYNADEYFAKVRPDRESRCTWTQDSCPKESPHLHDDNM